MAKILMQPRAGIRRGREGQYPSNYDTVDWKKAEPFFMNPRGILVHRPRSISTHFRNDEVSHCSVEYWCGNGCCFEIEGCNELFTAKPPEGRLVCAFCELKAIAAEQKASDTLAGKHVHKGKLVAVRTCCQGCGN